MKKSTSQVPESSTQHNSVNNQTVWPFLGWWILTNGIGVGAGVAAGWVLAGVLLPIFGRLIIWAGVGVIAGVTQYLVLRYPLKSTNWIWASIAGWAIGGTLAGREEVDWAVIGIVVGVMQWLVLRQDVYRAGWWLLACAAGLVVGGFVGGSVILLEDFYTFKTQVVLMNEHVNEVVGWIVSGLVGGASNGLITGLWLVWLLSKTTAKHPPHTRDLRRSS